MKDVSDVWLSPYYQSVLSFKSLLASFSSVKDWAGINNF